MQLQHQLTCDKKVEMEKFKVQERKKNINSIIIPNVIFKNPQLLKLVPESEALNWFPNIKPKWFLTEP